MNWQEFFLSVQFQWVLIGAVAVIGFIVQARLKSVFNKYSKVMFRGGLTGREVAEKMLRDNGIHDVKVVSTPGQLTDHYNPKTKTVNLSQGVYDSNSVSAVAVAAHECGHAVQDATEYAPMKMRSMLVPLISVTSQMSLLVILAGLFIATLPELFWIGIGMVALSAVFALITLPVEYNASARAMVWLESSRTLSDTELRQAKTALSWAARTYLVAALSAIVTVFYWIAVRNSRN